MRKGYVENNFLLSVKAVTLLFISRRGLAISSAKQGKSELMRCSSRENVRAFHVNRNRIHTELTFINP